MQLASFKTFFLSLGILTLVLASCGQVKTIMPPDYPAILAASSQSELWWVSLLSNEDVKVGPIRVGFDERVSNVFDIAWSGAGTTAWAVGDEGYNLYQLNITNGRATLVGRTGVALNALAVDAQGRLIGLAGTRVYMVNPSTGAANPVSDLTLPGLSSGDAVFADSDILYASVGGYQGDYLVKMDLTSKQVATVGNTGFSEVYALSFKDGVLYGATSSGALLRIDTSTGAGVALRYAPVGLFGAQSVP